MTQSSMPSDLPLSALCDELESDMRTYGRASWVALYDAAPRLLSAARECERLREENTRLRETLAETLRPFAEAQGVADLMKARGKNGESVIAAYHIRPSAFRIARDVLATIVADEALKGPPDAG